MVRPQFGDAHVRISLRLTFFPACTVYQHLETPRENMKPPSNHHSWTCRRLSRWKRRLGFSQLCTGTAPRQLEQSMEMSDVYVSSEPTRGRRKRRRRRRHLQSVCRIEGSRRREEELCTYGRWKQRRVLDSTINISLEPTRRRKRRRRRRNCAELCVFQDTELSRYHTHCESDGEDVGIRSHRDYYCHYY
jgi:hypothetical protein